MESEAKPRQSRLSTERSRKVVGARAALAPSYGFFSSMHRQPLEHHQFRHSPHPPHSTSLPCPLAFSGSLGARSELPKHTYTSQFPHNAESIFIAGADIRLRPELQAPVDEPEPPAAEVRTQGTSYLSMYTRWAKQQS
jgi:hypothetical protein